VDNLEAWSRARVAGQRADGSILVVGNTLSGGGGGPGGCSGLVLGDTQPAKGLVEAADIEASV
jgi:hypothetical protein